MYTTYTKHKIPRAPHALPYSLTGASHQIYINKITQLRKKQVNSPNNLTRNTGCTDMYSKMKQDLKYTEFPPFKMMYQFWEFKSEALTSC